MVKNMDGKERLRLMCDASLMTFYTDGTLPNRVFSTLPSFRVTCEPDNRMSISPCGRCLSCKSDYSNRWDSSFLISFDDFWIATRRTAPGLSTYGL